VNYWIDEMIVHRLDDFMDEHVHFGEVIFEENIDRLLKKSLLATKIPICWSSHKHTENVSILIYMFFLVFIDLRESQSNYLEHCIPLMWLCFVIGTAL